MSEVLKAVEDGIKSVHEKVGTELKSAMEKYDGQLLENGKVAKEARDEVKALADQYKELNLQLVDLAQKQSSLLATPAASLCAGEEFIRSDQYKNLVAGGIQRARIEVKALVSDTTTAFPAQAPGVIGGSFVPLTVRSLFRAVPVSTNMVNSLREASWTNSAAEVAQGSAKAESVATFEQYNVPITTVAHWLKVSNQLLADAPAVAAYIDTRLRDGLAQRIDAQLLNGNGTSPNLSGLTDSGNYTAYSATSDDTLVDAINRAKYALWAKGYSPDTVIVNPAAWGAMERTREYISSSYGNYLYGPPGTAAAMNPFGVRVVLSSHMSAGNFWIGNVAAAAVLYVRQGSTVEMGFVDDDFTKNLVTIRAEERLGLGVERPSATYYGAFTTT